MEWASTGRILDCCMRLAVTTEQITSATLGLGLAGTPPVFPTLLNGTSKSSQVPLLVIQHAF